MTLADYLETTYQRYRNLRDVAQSVYARKFEGERRTFEEVCTIVAFEFDANNQQKVADAIGRDSTQMILELCALSTGARLEKQGK